MSSRSAAGRSHIVCTSFFDEFVSARLHGGRRRPAAIGGPSAGGASLLGGASDYDIRLHSRRAAPSAAVAVIRR